MTPYDVQTGKALGAPTEAQMALAALADIYPEWTRTPDTIANVIVVAYGHIRMDGTRMHDRCTICNVYGGKLANMMQIFYDWRPNHEPA